MCARTNGNGTRHEECWCTLADAARLLGVTPQYFQQLRRTLADSLSKEDIYREGRGKPTWIYMPHLIEALIAHRTRSDKNPDAQLRLKKQQITLQREENRLQREAIELQRLQGNTLSRQHVRDTWNLVAGHIRRGMISLERRCGAEAHGIVDKCLRDAERAIQDGTDMRADTEDRSTP